MTRRVSGDLTEQAAEVLRRRADSLAQREEADAVEDRMDILLFALADEWYAVRIVDVREIYNEYRLAGVPCVPEHILGVINIRGEIVSVTDLAALMRLAAPRDLYPGVELPPLIVVQDDSCASAIVVDVIGDIVDVAVSSVEPPLSTYEKTQGEYVSGQVYVDGMLVGLVNLAKVLEPVGARD
ncbi:MAG: chemotaxis protein CheW [Coriobacteriia bacterium]